MYWLLLLASLVIFAIFAGYLADEKGYPMATFIAAGIFVGPISFLCAIGLPDKKLRRELKAVLEDAVATRPQTYPQVTKSDLPAVPPVPRTNGTAGTRYGRG